MGNSGMTPTLVQTLKKSKDEKLKAVAADNLCKKVRQFSDGHPDYIKAVGENACEQLVGMLKTGTPEGKKHAAACLSFLVRHPANKEKIAACGGISALIELSKEGQVDQQAAVACALANLASGSEANQAALAKAGAADVLVATLKSGKASEAKGWAVAALGNLVQTPTRPNEKNQKTVAEAGAIPLIVELLQEHEAYVAPLPNTWYNWCTCKKRSPPHKRTSLMAARALSQLCFTNAANQAQAVEAGAVEVLVKVMKEGSPEDETEAMRTLHYVWGDKKESPIVKAKLLDADGIRVLIEIVQNSSDDPKAAAATWLGRLAHQDASVQSSIATNGAIPALVELGNSLHPHCKMNAAKALKELATDNAEIEKMVEDAGGKPLFELVSSGMKFRELNDEERQQLQEKEERAAALMKEEESKEEDVKKPLDPKPVD
jgi:hypothetical protein